MYSSFSPAKKKLGVYVGSFNPWHKGHQNIYNKAYNFFDKVIVGIAQNENKDVKGLNELWDILQNVEGHTIGMASTDKQRPLVHTYAILVDFLNFIKETHGHEYNIFIVRGLRDGKDIDEDLNGILPFCACHGYDPIYFVSDFEYRQISSTKIREETAGDK